ncbi:MAG: hypothetical protein OWQ48_02005 [Desulfurococcus sp.]|nr:hypothetical protein [Desulfurococcus sp.]
MNPSEIIESIIMSVGGLVPRLAVSALAAAIFALVSVLVFKLVSILLSISRVDDFTTPMLKRYRIPFTLSSLVKGLLAFALALLTLYASIAAGFPEYTQLASEIIVVSARIASVISMIILAYIAVNYLVEMLGMRKGLGGFMALLMFNITLILVVDIAVLTPEVKQALTWGLSLGLGLTIAVFAVWYFFGDVCSRVRQA